MKAAVFSEFGGPEVVRIDEMAVPEPGPGEVRIAVRAAAMNHLDLWIRRGLPIKIIMPHIGGSDVAGLVDAVGPPGSPGSGPQVSGVEIGTSTHAFRVFVSNYDIAIPNILIWKTILLAKSKLRRLYAP